MIDDGTDMLFAYTLTAARTIAADLKEITDGPVYITLIDHTGAVGDTTVEEL